VFLVDLVPFPVNKLSRGERRTVLREHVGALVDEVRRLNPVGIIICHTGVYREAAKALREAALPLLHDEPIAFPLYKGKPRFPVQVRRAAARLD
jgi:hypothetical protein